MLLLFNTPRKSFKIVTSDLSAIPRVGEKVFLHYYPNSEVKSVDWFYSEITPNHMPDPKNSQNVQVVINCD